MSRILAKNAFFYKNLAYLSQKFRRILQRQPETKKEL